MPSSKDKYIKSHWFNFLDSTPRMRTVGRIIVGVPFLILSLIIITPAVILIAAIFGAIDLFTSLILGRQFGHSSGSTTWRIYRNVDELWDWNEKNLKWTIQGGGIGFKPLPDIKWETR